GKTIYNTGREGIKISQAPAVKVTYNVVHDAMLQTTDGGGIYTFGTNGQGAEIAYNRVSNVKSGGWGAVGIMLDNNSTNYVIHHNLVWNTNHALKMNYAAKNNKVYNNTLAGLTSSIDTSANANFGGSVFRNNIFTKQVKFGGGATWSNNINPGTDARFVNPAGGNFQLSSNSPAVNRGAFVSPYTNGYAGSAPDIGALDNGDWVRYDHVNFGNGVTKVTALLAVPSHADGQTIEVRVGGLTGTLLGKIIPADTGGWAKFESETAAIKSVKGVQDLYLVFHGTTGVAVLDSLRFS